MFTITLFFLLAIVGFVSPARAGGNGDGTSTTDYNGNGTITNKTNLLKTKEIPQTQVQVDLCCRLLEKNYSESTDRFTKYCPSLVAQAKELSPSGWTVWVDILAHIYYDDRCEENTGWSDELLEKIYEN